MGTFHTTQKFHSYGAPEDMFGNVHSGVTYDATPPKMKTIQMFMNG